MKNFRSQFWNNPVKNKTQNRYSRFLNMPRGKMRTAFTDSQESFKEFQGFPKTIYDEFFRGTK